MKSDESYRKEENHSISSFVLCSTGFHSAQAEADRLKAEGVKANNLLEEPVDLRPPATWPKFDRRTALRCTAFF